MPRGNGKRFKRGERFAKIPVEVLEHAACATLPLAAFKVMVVLASGYTGSNNGTLALTESWGRKFGINGTDTGRLALKELAKRGLIEMTRKGIRMRKVPTLWALSWQPINNRDGQPIEHPHEATHHYAKWTSTEIHPDGGGSVTTSEGVERVNYTPIEPLTLTNYTPIAGDTLRSRREFNGSHRRSFGSSSSQSQSEDTGGAEK